MNSLNDVSYTSELVCLSTCDNQVPLEMSDMIEILALTTYPTMP